MCGILAIIGEDHLEPDLFGKLKILIDYRGPDYSAPVIKHHLRCGLQLKLAPSVLHLRGTVLQEQPVIDEAGNILMFNGQVYEFSGNRLNQEQSDTIFLCRKLSGCKSAEEVAKIFSAIDGPFAFVYWHENLSTLFYGRDIFGRKSLCTLNTSNNVPIIISSLGLQACRTKPTGKLLGWTEVDCSGIHSLNFSITRLNSPTKALYLWNVDDVYPRTSKCISVSRDADVEVIHGLLSNPLVKLSCDQRLPGEFGAEEISSAVRGLEEKLIQSISKRIKYNRSACLLCRQTHSPICDHSKIAVAFSGGLDSTIIALFIDRVFDARETIDLITVAFKSDSPDRESVGIAFKELRKLRPNRRWRLVVSDIARSTLEDERQKLIRHLIMPCNTVVDDSLGCACWFISRGYGRSLDSYMGDTEFEKVFDTFLMYNVAVKGLSEMHGEIQEFYTSPATIFFAGMGIDEQLGGYSSHRAAWSKSGIKGIIDEISFQMRRISSRNLGRDDRTFSHHGRDVKLPYLDFDLVCYLNQLPVGLKMDLSETSDVGPKKLLRELAVQSGLQHTSRQVKRALQFGSRIAKLEGGGEKGGDICQRLA